MREALGGVLRSERPDEKAGEDEGGERKTHVDSRQWPAKIVPSVSAQQSEKTAYLARMSSA